MTDTAYERLCDALRQGGVVRQRDTTAIAQCPAHEDRNPSLSVRAIEGSVLLCCHTGCSTDDILTALHLTRADLYDDPKGARYDYTDATGTLVRTVHRTPDKKFRQSGNTKDAPPLFRLPKILEAVADNQVVYLVEGEKDVLALESVGAVATTAPQGASNFGKVDSTPLHGAVVRVIADNDDPGRKWAADVRDALHGKARDLTFWRAATGKDAADHIAAGKTSDQLLPLELEDEYATWAPVDLTEYLNGTHKPILPTLLVRTDDVALIYPGMTHSFHGESESGKSMLLQIEAARLVMDGHDVLFVDFESDPGSVTDRLLLFGATPAAIREHFHYIRPEVKPNASAAELKAWEAMLTRRYTLAVIDGVTDALGLFGYSTKDNDEISAWARVLPKNIAASTGAGVATIDHVTKDADTRGRFAIGGQAKMAGLTGAGYVVEIAEPLGRGLRGVISVRVAKDRPGYVRGNAGPYRKGDRTQEVARVVVDSTVGAPVVTIEPFRGSDGPDTPAKPFRFTFYMELVSKALEDAGTALSQTAIEQRIGKNAANVRKAIATLIDEGFLSVTDGQRNAKMHSLVAVYRQHSDPLCELYDEAPRPTPSEPRPDAVGVTPSARPSPYGDADGVAGSSGGVTPSSSWESDRTCSSCHKTLSTFRAYYGKANCLECETKGTA